MTGEMTLVGCRGRVSAKLGDCFRWFDGSTWQITKFTGPMSYSPSGLGGTPTVECRIIAGDIGPQFEKYTVCDLCDWCGDSVANALIESGHALVPSPQALQGEAVQG